jgi:CPA2 family monovalent cation:H+ antiporter-2
MSGWDLLPRIVLLLGAAAAAGLLMRRLRQSVIVGYLLAGVLLGPTGLGLVRGGDDVAILSELGVALLLFSIGLEFSLARLREFGRVALGAGTIQILVTTCVMAALAYLVTRDAAESVTLGMAFAMSSTAIVLRTLTDRAELDSIYGRNAIGILLLQDLAVIPVLIGTEALGAGSGAGGLPAQFVIRLGLVALFLGGAWLLARLILPAVLSAAVLSGSRELPVVIAVCTSVGAAWTAHLLGFEPSLGAFLAGLVLAESPFALQIRADVAPLSAVFVTLFFASVGTVVQLPINVIYLVQILLGTAVVMLLKALIASGAVYIFQRSARSALVTGIVISQVGEFTFVVAQTARRSGVVGDEAFQVSLGISLLALLLTPYVIAIAPALASRLVRRVPVAVRAVIETDRTKRSWRRVIVIGYGPAGQDVVQQLQADHVPLLVLEMNPNTVAANHPAIPIELADATQREVLQDVGLGQSLAVIVTIPDPTAARLICQTAQRLAPSVPIIARSRYHQYARSLAEAGADRVVDEEHMVGAHLAQEAMELVMRLEGDGQAIQQ